MTEEQLKIYSEALYTDLKALRLYAKEIVKMARVIDRLDRSLTRNYYQGQKKFDNYSKKKMLYYRMERKWSDMIETLPNSIELKYPIMKPYYHLRKISRQSPSIGLRDESKKVRLATIQRLTGKPLFGKKLKNNHKLITI